MFKFAYDCIPSNLFTFPARHRRSSTRTTKFKWKFVFQRGPQRRMQSVFRSHNGIVQALQDRMQFLDNLFEVLRPLPHGFVRKIC